MIIRPLIRVSFASTAHKIAACDHKQVLGTCDQRDDITYHVRIFGSPAQPVCMEFNTAIIIRIIQVGRV